MQPSIAPTSEQLDPRFAASKHTTVPVSHTGIHAVARKLLLIFHLVEVRRLSYRVFTRSIKRPALARVF